MVVDTDEVVRVFVSDQMRAKAIGICAIWCCGDNVFSLAEAGVPGPEEELVFELVGVGLGMGEDEDVFTLVHSMEGK